MKQLPLTKPLMPILLATMLFLGCATTNVDMHYRKDVDTSKSKVIVFPMLLWDGKKLVKSNSGFNNPVLDAAFGRNWASDLGAKNVIVVPNVALSKIPGAYDAIDKFISVLDGVSAVEQTTQIAKFIETISTQFGDGALAFALVSTDESGFKKTNRVQVNMGLFDTKKLTWKWIAKTEKEASSLLPVPYPVFVQNLVDTNYSYIKKQNNDQVR